jgi:hypothetical protein
VLRGPQVHYVLTGADLHLLTRWVWLQPAWRGYLGGRVELHSGLAGGPQVQTQQSLGARGRGQLHGRGGRKLGSWCLPQGRQLEKLVLSSTQGGNFLGIARCFEAQYALNVHIDDYLRLRPQHPVDIKVEVAVIVGEGFDGSKRKQRSGTAKESRRTSRSTLLGLPPTMV